ncbi:hypothetical protein TNCV_1109771 [Trichonephila clavipes]|nr:hypothetical protein TNCV_1109771 [Trichonephila clavipes]
MERAVLSLKRLGRNPTGTILTAARGEKIKRNSAKSRFHDKGTQEYQRPDQCPAYLPFVLFRRYRVGREKGERDIKGGTGIERRREDLAHLHTSPDSSTSEVGGLRQPKEDPFTTKPRHHSETFNMQFPTQLWVGSSKVS